MFRQICGNEERFAPQSHKPRRYHLAAVCISPRYNKAGKPPRDELVRYGLAETLR